jgi:ribosomal protein S15P/S13E|tara:strand:+ start:400 stop:573 length:174 start_codon:yes stop_codon:yes gene_type:complete
MNKEQIAIILKKINSLKKNLGNNSKKDYLMIDKKFVEKIVNTLERILKLLESKENNK